MTDERRNSAGPAGPAKDDFVAPPEVDDRDESPEALPSQQEFWRPPVRFGSIPVEEEPLGWDRRRGFRKRFPAVHLLFQGGWRIFVRRSRPRLLWGAAS